jgi:hypothetical protein
MIMMMMMMMMMMIYDLQDTNFYAELLIDKWDMLISEYNIGGSFRIFRKGQIFQLTG